MATYEQLQFTSYTDVIVPFTTNNSLGVTDSCTIQLTGYTLPETPFTFTAYLSALENTYIGASMDKLIWDMGDGTFKTGVSVTHHYPFPGLYEVTTIFTNQNGVTHKNRLKQLLRVYNYIPDSLVWYTPSIADEQGGQPERVLAGKPSNDLTIYRMNSWQSWPVVSGDGGYYINLFSSGSKSRPLTSKQYNENADSHFVGSWRFVKNANSREPVERVQTDNDFIYVKKENNDIVRTTPEDSSAMFAGTSGVISVNYIDDNPNRLTSSRPTTQNNNTAPATLVVEGLSEAETQLANIGSEDKDIILYASFDTSKFPVTVDDGEITRFELLKQNYFQIYETQKVGLPIQVKFNYPHKLIVNSNGIPESGFDIKGYKLNNSPISTTIRTSDLDSNPLCTSSILPLSSRWAAPTTAFSGGDVTTDVLTGQAFVTMYLSGPGTTFDVVETPYKSTEDFKVWDIGQIVPKNEANKYVRVIIADRGTDEPMSLGFGLEDRWRMITILFSELEPGQAAELLAMGHNDYMYPGGRPRNWHTKSGEIYYGYVAAGSNYSSSTAVDMHIKEVQEEFTTNGSLLCITSMNQEVIDYKADLNKYRIFAQCLIDPPLSFTYEVSYYYITNPTNDIIWQLKPSYHREYSYGDDGMTQTYTPPISTRTPGNSGMYGMAVEPVGDMIAVDGDTDKVIRYWRGRNLRAEFAIRDVMPDEIRSNHYPDNPDNYGYTPSSVSMDKNMDYWVSFYDAVSTVKFSGETNLPIAYAAPNDQNALILSRSQSTSSHWTEDSDYSINTVDGRPGEYGENLITPAVVETCKNNDIVVTYTNPLCSFIARFDSTGKELFRYELPGEDLYFSGDICVDLSDHIWALAESTGLTYDGQPDMGNPYSVLYSLNENLTLRYAVSSLEGTSFQDMLKPAPAVHEEHEIIVNMEQTYDFLKQEYFESAILIEGYGDAPNPVLTLFEGNTYHFQNQYFNNGQHDFRFQTITDSNSATPLSAEPIEWSTTGGELTENVAGYGTARNSIYVTKDTPSKFLMVDQNYPRTLIIGIQVVKKPIVGSRTAESFSRMNNASFLAIDNNQNVWVSWGKRFCSRLNPKRRMFDTTVAVGSAFYDPRYDSLSAETYERRDNADRRSAIEGLACDTANNLLVVQNHDKIVYSMNSDNPVLSAYIKVQSEQTPYEDFNWVESLCSNNLADSESFLLYPDSYMTKEQIKVFLGNVNFTGSAQQKIEAYNNYQNIMAGVSGNMSFRTCHGANPVSATGFESEIRALGDWTGWRWINKYDERPEASDETTGFVSITGASEEFSLLPQTGTHEVVKINEDIDFAERIRTFMKQPALINNTKLYTDFNNAVFGTKGRSIDELGKRIYERIANYTSNTVDIDTCTVDALYGMSQMVGQELQKVGYSIPSDMKRIVDLLSINFSKLRGTRVVQKQDFEKFGNWDQNTAGINLGPELVFVFDWKHDHGYGSNDYIRYNGEYYESLDSVPLGLSPRSPEGEKYWKKWPGGIIRTMDKKRAMHLYKTIKNPTEQFDDWYIENVPVRKKLIQNIPMTIDERLVIHNEHKNKYTLAQARMIYFEDGRTYKMDLKQSDKGKYISVTSPNVRDDLQEYISTTEYTPLYTMIDNVITVIGDSDNRNLTIVLLRNRLYRFEIDSIDHPIIITESPGASASPVAYINDQYVEYGKLTIRTDDDPVWGPLPEKLYYQSANDPSISGTILLRDPEDLPGYSTKYDGLTAYSLNISVSSHNDLDRLGWGLSFPEGENAWQYHSIYEYIPTPPENVVYKNNIIDWDNTMTTIDFDSIQGGNAYDEWFGDGGIAEIMINKKLREGLDLTSGIDSDINNNNAI